MNSSPAKTLRSTVSAIGVCDLSHELARKTGFKSLSWWREAPSGKVHAFIALGEFDHLISGNPIEQMADWFPWLNLASITNGDIKPFDVFADNERDWIGIDFAGVYLGGKTPAHGCTAEDVAKELKISFEQRLGSGLECLLWGLWEQAPYAYKQNTPEDLRCLKSAHQIKFNVDETYLDTTSVTLL